MNYLFHVIAVLAVACCTVNAQEGKNMNQTLVVYFSHSGNTRALAEKIHSRVGGDIFEIKTAKPYPEAYRPTTEVARVELDNNQRPELASYVENMESYDTIYVGFPNWWGTMPMALYTFLERYDFTGKTIVPFLTHSGGGVQRCENDTNRVCANATVLPALVLSGTSARGADRDVEAWLKEIGQIR